MSKYTLVLDSSQISTFLECPELWNNQYKKRLVPVLRAADADEPMNAGTYGHALLDRYYVARAQGTSMNDAIEYALAFDPDITTCECGCATEYHKAVEAFQIYECTKCTKCVNFKARPFDLKLSTRIQVQTRLREYFFNYANNDIYPISPAHVEVGFSEPIYEDSENLFVLEGRIDLIGQLQGLNCIMDHKFQFKRHFIYPRSIQFKNYCLVTKCLMFMVNYIRLHKNPDQYTMQRVITSFTAPELIAWKKQLIEVFFSIKTAQLNETYTRHWNACKGYGETYDMDKPKYCKYTQLCEEYNTEMKKIKMDQLYQVSDKIWRPW